jgi:hypothetical protein
MKLVYITSVAAVAAIAVSTSAQTLLAHGVHPQCMDGSMAPDGKGPPIAYHRTPEAGVHIACNPPPGGKDPEFQSEQRKPKGNTKSLSVRR